MTMLDPNDISELAKLLCIRDKDGRPALRIGLLATLFFSEPWARQPRSPAAPAHLRRSTGTSPSSE
jgi:hypothetical protein